MIGFDSFHLQGEEISSLQHQIEENRMVHAVLISGEPGTGKRTLSKLLSSALLCTSETGRPCGKCTGCMLAASGEHPDMTIIEKGIPLSADTPKGRSTIPVDDIRELIRLCSRYAYKGGNRAVIIADAENMTVQAQNCLLKILEEPPENTFFLLTSAHPEQLLITVRSRCRLVRLFPWNAEYIRKVLTDSGIDPQKADKAVSVSAGSIGNAFRYVSDDAYWKIREQVMKDFFYNRQRSEVLTISSGWKERKGEADTLFSILEDDVRMLMRHRLDPEKSYDEIQEYPAEWKRFAEKASLEHFTTLTDKIREARRQNAFNVSFQAIIEQLLLTFIGESELWVN